MPEDTPEAVNLDEAGNAARLRRYWLTGKGSLAIRWNTPGDFTRCVRQIKQHASSMRDPEGYCAELHKTATGMWPGDQRNRESEVPMPTEVDVVEVTARNRPDEDPPESLTSVAEPTAPSRTTLTETVETPTAPDTAGSLLVQLITAGWGSSGYYSPAVLAEAAKQRRFHRDLPLFLDHPTRVEEVERPERSVRDLAAVLTEDARYDPGRNALVAQARVFAPYRELVAELAPHIGLSIRADGLAEAGEAEGRIGLIVTEITEATSVDFVTKAGRGGKVLAILESARTAGLREARTFGAWLESRLHLTLTQYADDAYGDGYLTRGERLTLSDAIGDGLQAWTARVQADAPQLFQRSPWASPEADTAMTESARAADEPGNTPTADVTDGPAPDVPNPQREDAPMSNSTGPAPGTAGPADTAPTGPAATGITEAAVDLHIQAREAEQARVKADKDRADAEAARDAALREAEAAKAELARFRAVESARPIAIAALAETDLPAAARDRVLAAVTARVPLTEVGGLNEAKLKELVEAEAKAEAGYLATLAEANGAGRVRGVGTAPAAQPTLASVAPITPQPNAALIEAYKARGMSAEAASLAAAGRPA